MEIFQVVAVAALAAAVVAGVLVVLARRQGGVAADAHDLEAELASLRDAKADVERRLAVEEQKALRVPELLAAVTEKQRVIDEERNGRMVAEQKLAAASEAITHLTEVKETTRQRLAEIEETARRIREEKGKADTENAETVTRLAEKIELVAVQRQQIEALTAELKQAVDALSTLRADQARLQETLDQEVKQGAEKVALLQAAREQMAQQFDVLANNALKSQGESFSKQNKEQIEGLLNPLKERIVEFQGGMQAAQTESAKERASLAEQIRHLSESSARMSQEAHNLTTALKGKAQTQGAWGEMLLATILERSGLRKGEEYIQQESHSLQDGGRLRPDVVVNLPNAERIVVDAKVSLTAFEGYVNAVDEGERSVCLARHLASMRAHIKELAAKEYQNLGGSQLNFVIMFVPIEGALAAALQEDPTLTMAAAEAHVAIATPTTLMVALKTVASLWQIERRNLNAEAIADRAGKLYDKFVGFADDMMGLGRRIDQAKITYDEAMGKLSKGRGNLVGQAEKLKAMGAKTAKSVPSELRLEEEAVALPAPEAAEV